MDSMRRIRHAQTYESSACAVRDWPYYNNTTPKVTSHQSINVSKLLDRVT